MKNDMISIFKHKCYWKSNSINLKVGQKVHVVGMPETMSKRNVYTITDKYRTIVGVCYALRLNLEDGSMGDAFQVPALR